MIGKAKIGARIVRLDRSKGRLAIYRDIYMPDPERSWKTILRNQYQLSMDLAASL